MLWRIPRRRQGESDVWKIGNAGTASPIGSRAADFWPEQDWRSGQRFGRRNSLVQVGGKRRRSAAEISLSVPQSVSQSVKRKTKASPRGRLLLCDDFFTRDRTAALPPVCLKYSLSA